jgi:hypothetical protein
MRPSILRFCFTLAALLVTRPAFPHHSFAAEFDGTQFIALKGVITKLEWANPHGWIYLDVKGSDGKAVNWAVETGGPNALIRRGIRRTDFPVGTEITITGYRAKNGTATANARTLTLADGRELFAGSSGTGAPVDGAEKSSK